MTIIKIGSLLLLIVLVTWALRTNTPTAPAAVRVHVVETAPAVPAPVDEPAPVEPARVHPARAAYYLSRTARECTGVLGLYEKLGVQDERFEACARYLTEPLPDWRYWQAKALEGRDLLARLDVQGETWLLRHQHWDELYDTMQEASRSQDPEVQFALAQLWLNPEIGGGDGVALLERACQTLACPESLLETYRDY